MSSVRSGSSPNFLARLSQAAARAWSQGQLAKELTAVQHHADCDSRLPDPLPCCGGVRPKYHVHPALRGVLKNHISRKEDEIQELEAAMRSFGFIYSPKNKLQSIIFMQIFQRRKELSSLLDDLEECEANALLERELREAEEAALSQQKEEEEPGAP